MNERIGFLRVILPEGMERNYLVEFLRRIPLELSIFDSNEVKRG